MIVGSEQAEAAAGHHDLDIYPGHAGLDIYPDHAVFACVFSAPWRYNADDGSPAAVLLDE